MNKWMTMMAVSLSTGGGLLAPAEPAAPFQAWARMPVREVTVFKDGHAVVLHAGKMPTDAAGDVVLDYLPVPVVGTFWPYAEETGPKLTSVTAGSRKIMVDRTALNLRELLEANIGATAVITEQPAGTGTLNYTAVILGLPAQSGAELEATSLPYAGDKLPLKGNVVLLKTDVGVKVVNLDRIQDVTFKGEFKQLLPREEFRNLLTLKLDWAGKKPEKEAAVGMFYVQRGIRWIPEYKLTVDGKGGAVVKLQATLLNELADLEDVTVNLVVGVPTFLFKETVDPISLQQAMAQLSSQFRPESQTAYAFSNAIMTQAVGNSRFGETRSPAAGTPPMDLGPEVATAGKTEDFFIYTTEHITLKKGQRQVIQLREFPLQYRDVYTLDIPFAPPPELRNNANTEQQAELARLFNAPKAVHRIRLQNSSDMPLTTAPVLIVLGGRVLAQSLMTYTAPGGAVDLEITAAVDLSVKKSDIEVKRTPNAVVWQGDQYGQVDLAGTIKIVSFKKEAVEIEVTRGVLGNVGEVNYDGKAVMVNLIEDTTGVATALPYWWRWYSWPHWWTHFNGMGRFSWTLKIEPGQAVELNYGWHYFWR